MYLRLFVQDDLNNFIKKNCTTDFRDEMKEVKSLKSLIEIISNWSEVQLLIRESTTDKSNKCLGNCYLGFREKYSKEINYSCDRYINV